MTLGLPGSLPVLNRRAVELAIRIGVALHCEVQPCLFHRKNYFYPDMPKDYQISQYDQPLNVDGWLELPSGKRIGIERAHMEEDTGKSTHIGGTGGRIHGSDYSLVDYNRAGVPLVEIVGRPDIRTPDEARQYVNELRAILVAIDASDAKMEEGSMRVDANVSVHRPGEPFGTRCEIKNLNSVRSLGRAIEYEARRQIVLLGDGEVIRQETRHWNENDGRTHTLRTKEDADDYRYFPEPDLVPLVPDAEWVEEIRRTLPPLPAERRATLAAAAGVEATNEAVAIAVERGRDGLAAGAIEAGGDPARVLVHIEHNLAPEGPDPVTPTALAALTALEVAGTVTPTQAKQVLAEVVAAGGDGDPAAIAAAKGFEAMGTDALEAAVDAAIAEQAGAWAKYCAGEDKAAGALVGAVMKATRGQADGKAVTALLQARRARRLARLNPARPRPARRPDSRTVPIEIRTPEESDVPALFAADGRGFGVTYEPDEPDRRRPVMDLSRFRIAVEGGAIVGIAGSFALDVTVPGGAALPMGGVTWVSVAATHRRQGLLRRLLAEVHADIDAREEPVAGLSASEGGIYGRFGYGVASQLRRVSIDTRAARLRDEVTPKPGTVRFLEGAEARAVVPELWDRCRVQTAGETSRSPEWWDMAFADQSKGFDGFSAVFRLGHEDGYAAYRIRTRWNEGAPAHELDLIELCAATADAHAALWHTLLGIDLVGSIRSRRSVPLDDALPHLLQNPRAVRTEGLDDNLWLRPHRPGVLLGARTYGTEDRLVLEVTPDAIDAPSTRWEVDGGPDGATASRTRRRADLSLDRASARRHLPRWCAPLAAGPRPSHQ